MCAASGKAGDIAVRRFVARRSPHSRDGCGYIPARPTDPAFPGIRGGSLSRNAVERLVARHTCTAAERCASLKGKKVTPHGASTQHGDAALRSRRRPGGDRAWLEHESVETTQVDLHADLRLKEQALARTSPLNAKQPRYKPLDQLLVFLEGL
jgi:hypothetical protein